MREFLICLKTYQSTKQVKETLHRKREITWAAFSSVIPGMFLMKSMLHMTSQP